ncbi:hypothetical protein ASG84_25750 [Rhodococcus sp. Leaf278]|nr:hypothetical protein ASG84_25750 [Rhodococcus sp. Leaf278]
MSVPLWDRAAELASHVEDHLGVVPIGRTDVDVFIGRYKSTKAGIHQDFAHNLSLTLRGPKRLVTWPPDCADLLPARSAEYEHLLDKAVVLNGKPGGVTYLPPDEFHIGESPDAATIALNVVFFEVTRDPLEEALMPVRSLLNPVAPIRGRGDGSTMNPAAVLSAFDQIEKMLADRSAHRISVARWLRSSTSARLDAARPLTSTTSALPSRVRLRSGARLLYTSDPSNSSMLLYSCDVNVAAAAQTPFIETLLNDLATGSIVEPPPEDEGTQVLGTLHEWGGVESA